MASEATVTPNRTAKALTKNHGKGSKRGTIVMVVVGCLFTVLTKKEIKSSMKLSFQN